MRLAGILVSDASVLELVRLLRAVDFDDLAERLDDALERRTQVLGLTVPEREELLRALDDPPSDGLAELRAVLLAEHEWRVREGLV